MFRIEHRTEHRTEQPFSEHRTMFFANPGNSTGGAHKVDFWSRNRSRWVRTARAIHLDQFSSHTASSGPIWDQTCCFWSQPQLWRDLTSPVLLCTIPAGAFFSTKMATRGFDKPCCCYPACRRRFFFGEIGHPGFDKPCCCSPACRRRFLPNNNVV